MDVPAHQDARPVQVVDALGAGVGHRYVGNGAVHDDVDALQRLGGQGVGHDGGKAPPGGGGGVVVVLVGGDDAGVQGVLKPAHALRHGPAVVGPVEQHRQGHHLAQGDLAPGAEAPPAVRQAPLVEGADALLIPGPGGHVGEDPGVIVPDLPEVV